MSNVPLRAALDGRQVDAIELDEHSWNVLKKNYSQRTLSMPCCQSAAIPKTSSLGTHFFAHARRGGCANVPESEEHLLAKTAIARGARQAGWTVQTEAHGLDPEGGVWIADVYAVKGSVRVAFEVQWSAQELATYRDRQSRYERSGVRAAWFARRMPAQWPLPTGSDALLEKVLPIFALSATGQAGLTVLPWRVELARFVAGMLQGRLAWHPDESIEYELEVQVDRTYRCYRCKMEAPILRGVGLRDRRFGVVSEFGLTGLDELRALLRRLPKGFCEEHGIAPLGLRRSDRSGSFFGQGCAHCDAPFDPAWFIRPKFRIDWRARQGARIPAGPISKKEDVWGLFTEPEWRWLEDV